MLWRAAYNTWEPAPAPIPEMIGRNLHGQLLNLDGQVVLCGGFDLRASAELGVWRRLLQSLDTPIKLWTIYLLPDQTSSDEAALASMTPKSLWSNTYLARSTSEWSELIQPDRPERSFAALAMNGVLDPLMIGLPTEEAWYRFQSAL